MKITFGTLFLVVAVFLDSIEFISSIDPVVTTLAQLFPGYTDGSVLPPIKVFVYRTAMRTLNLQQIGDRYYMTNFPPSSILARGDVILAWRGSDSYSNGRKGDYIQPLWKLFPIGDEKCWVFDTNNKQWVTLSEVEFKRLGVGHILTLVETQQYIAARYRLSTGTPEHNHEPHNHAYDVANREVDALQAIEARRIRESGTSVSDSQKLIRDTYMQAYSAAFYEKQRELYFRHLMRL